MADEFDLDNAIQTNAEFSDAVAVMARHGGWKDGDEQKKWVGARFAASMRIYTQGTTCKTLGSSN